MSAEPLLRVTDLRMEFGSHRTGPPGTARTKTQAVDGVSFDLFEEQTLGLVGESGSGKSTLGYCVVGLLEPTGGTVQFMGNRIVRSNHHVLREARRHMQMVFQDPSSSLNPRMRVCDIVAEPLVAFGIGTRRERRKAADELLEAVGLSAAHGDRYPKNLSGGQMQRVAIARAIALRPRLVVCDEAVSALDVSVRAQILNLLKDLQEQFKVAYLFIAHDLAAIRAMSDHVAVMKGGVIVEHGPADDVFRRPEHAYTKALLAAVPAAPKNSVIGAPLD